MKQRVKRWSSLVLAVAMSLSLLSANVWAAEMGPDEEDLIAVQSEKEMTEAEDTCEPAPSSQDDEAMEEPEGDATPVQDEETETENSGWEGEPEEEEENDEFDSLNDSDSEVSEPDELEDEFQEAVEDEAVRGEDLPSNTPDSEKNSGILNPQAVDRTRDEAVQWVYAQQGKKLDYDGAYGAQCVDLIKYYYNYFGVASYARGNGSDYVSNALPDGWVRIKNTADFLPEPGDIAVWGTGLSKNGHVAIILTATLHEFVSMDQNWPSGSACKQVTHSYQKGFWGVIRPKYSGRVDPCNCSSNSAGTYICTSQTTLKIRSGHGTNYPEVNSNVRIPSGAEVYVSKSNGEWAHVSYNGVEGLSAMQYLQKKEEPKYAYLDVNGYIDNFYGGYDSGALEHRGTVDVYINGTLVADDVDDYYASWPVGTRYEVKDIKNKEGVYTGVREGGLNGQIGESGANVRLTFEPRPLTNWDNEPVYLINKNSWRHLESVDNNVEVSGKNALDPRQIWIMEKQGDGSYMIRNEYNGWYLDADAHDGTVTQGRNVQVWKSNGGANQRWRIYGLKDAYMIMSAGGRYVLDLTDGKTESGTNVQIWPPNETDAQCFSIYALANDRKYERPEKPTGPGSHIDGSIMVGKPFTVTWEESPLRDEHLDERTYNVAFADQEGNVLSSTVYGLTGTSAEITLNDTSAKQMWVTAVNTKYDNYWTRGPAISIEVKPSPKEYRVTFDPNGGSGSMNSETAVESQPFTLPENGFQAPEGMHFKAWAVGGKEYQSGNTIIVEAETTAKAVWEKNTTPTPAPANADAVFSVGSVSTTPGGEISVPVSITKNPGIAGFALDVDYDHNLLTLKNAVVASGLGGTFTHHNDSVTWFAEDNVTLTGKVFELTFDVAASAGDTQTDIVLTMHEGKPNVTDQNSANLTAAFEKGTVTIRSYTPGDVTGDNDVTIADVVKINRHVVGKVTLTSAERQAADVTGDKDVTIADVVKVNRFVVGRITTLTVTKNLSTQSSSDATITVGSVNAKPGEKVSIPVILSGNPGIAGMALEFTLPEGMTLDSITADEVLKDGMFTENGNTITWYTTDNITQNGKMLNLNVTAPQTAGEYAVSAALKESKASNFTDEDSENVGVIFEAGKVTVAKEKKNLSGCSITLAETKYTYDGKAKEPAVTVKDGSKTLTQGADFDVAYKNNVKAGTAAVTVTGKGDYTGTVEKTFTISKAPQSVTAELSVDTIHESGTAQITASGHGTIRYQSSNEDVADVDSSGAVTGKSVGTATIVVSAEDDPNYQSASKSVTIVVTHDFDSGVVTQKASCTENGVRTYTCAACEKTYTEVIPATGHDYGEKVTAPTCTERGYTTHTCRNCDDSYQDSYTDALGHDYDDGEVSKEPTGDEPGVKTYTCSRCRATKAEELPPKGHHYDEGQVTEKATCTQDGIRTFTCIDAGCGKTYTEVIPAMGHNYETKVTAPTCTKKGYTTHTCSSCKDSYRDSYVDALGHEYDDGIVMEEPSCEEEGLKEFTCTRCKKASYTTVIPAAGHKYTEKVTAPTCTKKGYTTHTCSVCKSSYKDQFTDATGHHFDKEKVIDAATCKEEGLVEYTCSSCNKTKTETIPVDKENHTGRTEVQNRKEANCGRAGYTGDTYCADCGRKIADGTMIPANGNHVWDEGKITREATCCSQGKELLTCTVCGDNQVETLPVDSSKHVHTQVKNNQEATCTKTGYTGDTWCVDCEEKISEGKEIPVDESNHTGGTEIRNRKAATCGNDGYTGDTYCLSCGEKLSSGQITRATGNHTWDSGTVTTQPTTVTEGVKTYKCTVCGQTRTESVAKLPQPVPVVKVDNTIAGKNLIFRTYNAKKDQSFSLGVSANGALLSYQSSNKKVTVKNGKVTIKKGFMGQVTITVTAAETESYLSAQKKITLMVGPSATQLSSVKYDAKKKVINAAWKKNTTGKGYEIQVSLKKDFKKVAKKVKINKNATVKTAIKGLKKGTYYVRIRTINGKTYSDWSKTKTVKIKK